MNPLLWPGPEFLGLYIGLLAAAAIFLKNRSRNLAGAGPGEARVRDHLAIAYLRAGPVEVLRVATLSLVDAGLVTCATRQLDVVPGAMAPQNPVAEAVFRAAERGVEAHTIITLPSIVTALTTIEEPLRREGYLPSPEALAEFRRTGFIIIGLLAALAASKLMVALAGGHHRVIFLLMASGIGLQVLYRMIQHKHNNLTPAGQARLAQVQTLFATFKDSNRFSSLSPEERRFTAAAFGGAVLGPMERALWEAFSPPTSSSCTSTSSDSSGLSSDSDGGSGSSSGCGGGGCGGCGGGGGD